jgi:tetratricopeptide (TPR) repeat protein
MSIKQMTQLSLFFAVFFTSSAFPIFVSAWSWNSADNALPSLREELDKEIAAYRLQVGNGMSLQDRIIALDRLIGNYQPLGLNMVELETERSRLMLQEKQRQLRSAEMQTEATQLYERGVAEYREGQYRVSMETFQEAERLLPDDTGLKEVRRKLQGIAPILESEVSSTGDSKLIRLALTRYLENDPKR